METTRPNASRFFLFFLLVIFVLVLRASSRSPRLRVSGVAFLEDQPERHRNELRLAEADLPGIVGRRPDPRLEEAVHAA